MGGFGLTEIRIFRLWGVGLTAEGSGMEVSEEASKDSQLLGGSGDLVTVYFRDL